MWKTMWKTGRTEGNRASGLYPLTEIGMMNKDSNALLQGNPGLYGWIKDCFSMSASFRDAETSGWVSALQTALEKADFSTTKAGYQELTEQLNHLLQPSYKIDKHTQNDWISALLFQLLAMHVYLQIATKYHPDQVVELQTKQWGEYAQQVMTTVPTELYLKQLSPLVDILYRKSIDSAVDRGLLKIHQQGIIFCFQQLLDKLRSATQNRLPPPVDEDDETYKLYIQMIHRLYSYTTELSTLPPQETAHIPQLLLRQLTELIESATTLDLSPSWIERLKEWIQACFSKLQWWFIEKPNTAKKTASSSLLVVSQRLKGSAKKTVQKKNLHASEWIRERCWFYFSLHEQLITHWWDEAHAEEYQSTALALFESFMSTFDWPSTFKKGILRENPLKSHRFRWFKRRQASSADQWESLLNSALEKLSGGLLITDLLMGRYSESFLYWLLSRQENRLMAKVKAYTSSEDYKEFQQLAEIPSFEKETLYRFVQLTYEDFCTDLNQITRVILGGWFKKMGMLVSHSDLANRLSKPGRWLHHQKQPPPEWEKDTISKAAFYLFEAIERLGIGLYFFPPVKQRWSVLQEALAAHQGNRLAFVHQHANEIFAIIRKLLFMFHLDLKSETERNDALFIERAQLYIPQIQSVKNNLQRFKEGNLTELQKIDPEFAADCLLRSLKNAVLDCMHCYVRDVRWQLNLPDTARRLSELRQIYTETIKLRQEKEAAQVREEAERREKEAERREKEAALEEIERLKALLAEGQNQSSSQASLAESKGILFFAMADAQASNAVTEKPVLTESNYAP